MRPHGKVDTPKPRDPKARNAGPDESPHSGPYNPEPSTTESNTPMYTPSHHFTPGNVYVEDDFDRVCESWLDIT
ncbi:hypothetical protein CDL15_Pgr006205 [Punica granatum]|uniref:Uncharacterized protein n=1 Tax=Punica granatum TaxID=22663 RepID=A0A218W213_PUNGR|nr:hypothetical protein CDL15_Pgr006205 [Punica granatum]